MGRQILMLVLLLPSQMLHGMAGTVLHIILCSHRQQCLVVCILHVAMPVYQVYHNRFPSSKLRVYLKLSAWTAFC